MTLIKDSAFWLAERDKTEDFLAELIHGSLSSLKSVKSDEDTASYHEMQDQIGKVRYYLNYCNERYKEALDKEAEAEGKLTQPKKHILYFEREFGY
ncbi:MAG: hypothetical protein ACRCZ0_10835 [Cetobacterium sp.]